MSNFKVDIDADGIALVTWDMAGRSMNVIDASVIEELAQIVDKVADDAKSRARSSPRARIPSAAAPTSPCWSAWRAPSPSCVKREGEEAANKMVFDESRKLSLVYRQLEKSGKPWVAAINGTAMGGGFELCLACHHRVAADNPKTRLGLPEVKVGLFPGAGGTQRVARMLPPADALQFLLKGQDLRVDRAKAMKLIDAVVPQAELIKAAKDWIKAGGKAVKPWDEKGFRLPGGPVYSKAGMMTFPAANAIYRRETYDNYPAARAILQTVYEGLLVDMDTALRIESRWFAKILRSPEAAAMIRSLFVSMQELNKGARRPQNVGAADQPEEDRHRRRRLHGRRHRAGERGGRHRGRADRPRPGNRRQGQGGARQGAVRPRHEGPHERAPTATRCWRRSRPPPTTARSKDCDLVIEAVFEDRKIKADVIKKIEAVLGDDAILASNTSTLPITSLAKEFKDAKRFIGIHFFSPVALMMLTEIILGKETGDKALAVALDFVRAIRKTPIVVNDSRGFYANRCVINYLLESHLMLLEGIPAAMIENVGAHGRHAGRPARAHRRDRARPRPQDRARHRSRSRPQGHQPGAEEAARGHGREERPLRPQERQGLLRLSAGPAQAPVAGPRRHPAEEAHARARSRPSTSRS